MTRFVLPDSPAELADDLLIASDAPFSGRLRRIADDILGAVNTSPKVPGVSYGLFGRWGTGKSSAARYLKDLLEKDRTELSGQPGVYSVTVRTIHAPNLFGDPALIKAQIGNALLEGISPADISKLAGAVARATGARTISGVTDTQDRVWESRRVLFNQMRSVDQGPFVLDALLRENIGRNDDAIGRVLILDEVDRTSLTQTIELLRSIDYWLRTPLVFFVVVADRDHLLRAIEEQSGVLDRSPEEALEKYIHHAVNVPDLLLNNARLRDYVTGLLNRIELSSAEQSAILDNISGMIGDVGDIGEISILDPVFLWDGNRNPRFVKQMLNRIVGEISEIVAEGGGGAELKRRVVRLCWPDFYREQVEPVLAAATKSQLSQLLGQRATPTDPRAEWLSDLAEVGRRARQQTMRDWGIQFAADSTRELAVRLRVHMQNVPEKLVLYLGSGPDLIPPVNGSATAFNINTGVSNAIVGDGSPEVKAPDNQTDIGLTLQQAVLEAQIARTRRSPLAAAQILRQLASSITDPRINEQYASILGTAAIEAESIEEFDLAWQFYRRAIELEPDGVTTQLNALDFLVKPATLTKEQTALGRQWAQSANQMIGPNPPLRRLRILERFYRKIDDDAEADRLRQRVLETGLANPDFKDFVAVISALSEQPNLGRTQSYVAEILDSVRTPDDAYVVLRTWADLLAPEEGPAEKNAAVAIYLDLIATGASCLGASTAGERNEEPLTDILGNLAILAYRKSLDELAGNLWRAALSRSPGDAALRRAYSKYLVDKADLEQAATVLRDGTVEAPDTVEFEQLRVAFEYDSVDRWWEPHLEATTRGLQPCMAGIVP